MKFVHIADVHFDALFGNLSNNSELGEIRRLEQREIFKKVIKYIKENNIKYLFISGDLYENEYVRQSTIEFINNQFKSIPQTKIFISPGNHDPYLKNSYYNKFYWNENVKIFDSDLSIIEDEETVIYGFGFDDFYYINNEIEKIKINNKEKINILIGHASLNASTALEKQYNPISEKVLGGLGFDYVALGHIHKSNYNLNENQRIIYPGSLVSLGFDEVGKHGMIVGEIQKNQINLQFNPLDEKEFIVNQIDVTGILDKDDLLEIINNLGDTYNYYKIELVGKRNFEINLYNLNKLILNKNIIKIKDKTILNYDLNNLKNENTLKGLFVQEVLEKDFSEEQQEKILEIGLEIL